MRQPLKSDVAVWALRRYFGSYPGVFRAEVKAPDVYPLEKPIDSYIPSSLEDVTDTEELLRQVVETAESFRKARQRVVNVTPVFQVGELVGEMMKALKQTIDFEFRSAFERLLEFDLQEITEKARVAGRELGERGWLVGPFMSPQGLFRALEEDTDQFMKERYPVDHLIGLVEESDNSRWQKTILESIYSYRDGRYRVVILTLLPTIEAFVRERARHRVSADGIDQISKLNRKAIEETDILSREEAFLLAASEASIVGFVEPRWGKSPHMLEDDPSKLDGIDRNWAVHGADNPERWNPLDAHRLLQAAAVLAHERAHRVTPEE